jgi:anaerobic magnesium-protoporphyrin IX monomethyl ester cyclase
MKIVFFVAEDKSLGVGYLSSWLKQHGHQVYLLFDPCQFSKSYIQNRALAKYFLRDGHFLKRIKQIQPDLIGFSVLTSNYQWALRLSGLIKKHFDIPIIFGGVHPTIVPDRVITQDSVDLVCLGEAEEALLELMDNFRSGKKDIRNIYFKDKGEVIRNPLRPLEQNLDKYPFPDEEIFYETLPASYRKTTSVMTSRGCPFSCTYCNNKRLLEIYKGEKYVRRRSVGNVIEELRLRKNKYKSAHFVFMDDVFSSEVSWLRDFVAQYKKHVGLPFNCLSHPLLVNDEIIGLLKEAGCKMINFGLQSGSERLRRQIFKRFESNECIEEIAASCRKNRIRFAIDHIFNVPSEADEDNLISAELYNQIRPNIINCYRLMYFPRSEIINISREYGLLCEEEVPYIEEGKGIGLYATVSLGARNSEKLSFYRRFAIIFSMIPLLPKALVRRILKSRVLRGVCAKIPLSALPIIKIMVDFKEGMGFIPFSVLKNEIFYTVQFFREKKSGFPK